MLKGSDQHYNYCCSAVIFLEAINSWLYVWPREGGDFVRLLVKKERSVLNCINIVTIAEG